MAEFALIVCIFGGLALICWSSWFSSRETAREQPTTRAMQSLIAEFRAAFNQEQLEMVAHMEKLHKAGYCAEATMLLDRLLPEVTDHNCALYVHLLLIKVDCLLRQSQIDEAEKVCMDYVQEDASKDQKSLILDGLASYILYQSLATHFPRGEKCARMGLELTPGILTLKGTLGSLLVEQGNYGEGEEQLTECLQQSQAVHDRAISSFYLGMIKMRTGNAKEGKRLIKWAMRMHPEAWMVAKGKALLKANGSP